MYIWWHTLAGNLRVASEPGVRLGGGGEGEDELYQRLSTYI